MSIKIQTPTICDKVKSRIDRHRYRLERSDIYDMSSRRPEIVEFKTFSIVNTVSRRGKTHAGNVILMYFSHLGECFDKTNGGYLLYIEMSTNSILGILL